MNRDTPWVRRTATTLRIILGLIFLMSGIGYFFTPVSMVIGNPTSPSGIFTIALLGTGYFPPFLKVVELLSGLILVFSRRFSAFALVLLAPIIIHIFLYSVFLYTQIIVVPVVLGLIEIFLVWYNWAKFAPLFRKA